ncbi:MAG: phytanoyl-CoA dioxygenase family protein, partial [Pirellulaceae bacterium]
MALASSNVEDPYFSRLGDQFGMAARLDPVVWSERPGRLNSSEIESYQRDGFLSIPQLISREEVNQLLQAADRLRQTVDPDQSHVIAEPASRTIRSVFRLHRDYEDFKEICRDPRIVERAEQILGSEVYLHQSRINFKPAFEGKEFFWHSDFETWHIEDGLPRMRAVSISLSLTHNLPYNGPLMLIPGSHRYYIRCVGRTPENHFEQSLRSQRYGVPDQQSLRWLVDAGGISTPTGGPGSAVMFDCNTLHGSVANLSPYPRTNLFLVFNSV